MNERLRIEIGQYGRVVFGRVLEQPEATRSCDGERIGTVHDGGVLMELCSEGAPQLTSQRLFIRGCHRRLDDDEFCCIYSTPKVAAQAVADIQAMVRKANAGVVQQDKPLAAIRLEVIE
jgi:hypothetical protein